MVRYEVTLDADPDLAEAVEGWLRGTHMADMGATGCFLDIRLDRASVTRFRTSYLAATSADVDRYFAEYAPEMRARFARQFPAGVTVAREIWEERATWR